EDQVRSLFRDGLEGVTRGCSADQFVLGERFFVALVLQIVVLDDENARAVHGLGPIYARTAGQIKGRRHPTPAGGRCRCCLCPARIPPSSRSPFPWQFR